MGVVDDPYLLLITHAQQWAAKANRALDADLLGTALSLRDTHDLRPGTSWPAGSVTELMTVRWPGHGPLDPPDVDALVATLDTFWRFLRATGRMASGSADVKTLVREGRRCATPMRDRLADPTFYGASKSIMAFGREQGMNLDEFDSIEQAQEQMAAIVDAWNALPQDERLARSPGTVGAGSKASAHLSAVAHEMLAGVDLTAYAAEHGMPGPSPAHGWGEGEDDDEEAIPVQDPAVVAAQVRALPLLAQVRALAQWIGFKGAPVTKIGVLRPATAREVIADLQIDEWMQAALGHPAPPWRSAGDHLGLDRLYGAAVIAGFLEVGPTKVVAAPERERDDEQWVITGLTLLVAAHERARGRAASGLLLGMLLALEFGTARTVDDLVAWWRHAPTNVLAGLMTDDLDAEQRSSFESALDEYADEDIRRTLGYWQDAGIVTTVRGRLRVTELGLDFTRILIQTHEADLDT